MRKDKTYICQTCERETPKKFITWHHLIPQSKGGKRSKKISICVSCHSHIHAIFSNEFLKNKLNTLEKLLNNEQMKRFIEWISKKDNFPTSKQAGTKLTKKMKGRYTRKYILNSFEKCFGNLQNKNIELDLERIYSLGFQSGRSFQTKLMNNKLN